MRFSLIIYAAALILSVMSVGIALAAGSIAPGSGNRSTLAGKILGNAWHRDGSVQVVVCNVSEAVQQIRVMIGTYDTAPRGFVQQRLTLEHGTASQLTFPVVQRKSPRGNMVAANFVFIYAGAASTEPVASLPIQNKAEEGHRPVLDRYMAWDGETVTLSMVVAGEPNLRLYNVSKGIKTSGLTLQGRLAEGSMAPATIDDLRNLDLPSEVKKRYMDRVKEEFIFVVPPGNSGWLAVTYDLPSQDGCAVAVLPVYRMKVGAGEGAVSNTLLTLNQQNIVFQPTLPLEPVDASVGKTKTR